MTRACAVACGAGGKGSMEENKNLIAPINGDNKDPVADKFARHDAFLAAIVADFPNVVIYSCEHIERRELPALFVFYLGADKRMAVCKVCGRVIEDTMAERLGQSAMGKLINHSIAVMQRNIDILTDVEKVVHTHWWQKKR